MEQITTNVWYQSQGGAKNAIILKEECNFLLLVRKEAKDGIIKSFYFYETFEEVVRLAELILGDDPEEQEFIDRAFEERKF